MTSTFDRYLCWHPSRVAQVAQTDAAALPRTTLLAIHHRFEPVRSTQPNPGTFSDEELLTAFLDPNKTLTEVFLVGDAGAGKSHLVQWMRARLSAEPNALIVYLPRNLTGLRGLLDRLIEGLEAAGARDTASELRKQLEHAYSQVRDDLPAKLADAMALALERMTADTDDRSASGKKGGSAGGIRAGIAQKLPHLLRDPVSRPFFFRTEGALERFVRLQKEPGRPEDSDTRFEGNDLPSPESLAEQANQLSGPAKTALRELYIPLPNFTPESQPLAVAVDLLNEALTKAIPEVFGLVGEQSLGAVLDFARRALLKQQRDLYLFVEDLAQLRGVDRELLDAIIDPAEENGVQVRCAVRVAIAVTEGYYNLLPEGVRSRGKKFDLTKRAQHVSEGGQDLERFASRYLRALRLSEEELDRSIDEAEPSQITEGTWVPNRCDECEKRTICHETFGDVDGVGLYPLNSEALREMAHSAFNEEDGNGIFNPRRLVQRVLGRVTERASAAELEQNEFPSLRLRDLFTAAHPLPATTLLAIQKTPEPDRRYVLAQFWGGGDREKSERNGVAAAFGLTPIKTTSPSKGGVVDPPQSLGAVSPEPDPTGVEKWFAGEQLPRSDADRLRNELYRACINRIDWGSLGLEPSHRYMVGPRKEGLSNVLRPFSFYVEGQIGDDNAPDKVKVQRTITRSNRNLVLRIHTAINLRSAFRVGLDEYCEMQDFLEDVSVEVTEEIHKLLWQQDPDRPIQSLVTRLVLGAIATAATTSCDALAVAKEALDPLTGLQKRGVSAEWNQFLSVLSENRQELAYAALQWMSYRQGEDEKSISLVRAGRLAFHINDILSGGRLPGISADYGIKDMAQRLSVLRPRDVTAAIARESEAIGEVIGRGLALIDENGWDAGVVVKDLKAAIDAAYREGVDLGTPEEIRSLIDGLENVEIADIPEAPSVVKDLAKSILGCSSVHTTGVVSLLQQLDRVSVLLEQGLRDVESHLRQSTDGATGGLGHFRVSVANALSFAEELT
jgi:GNAT superfamily N-acetyltransferase